jgi:hypothetical protein
MHSTTVATTNNAVQSRRMAKRESSRNTVTLNTTVSTSTVPTLPQPPSLLVDKENKEQLSDTRYKSKGKTPKIFLTNMKTEGEKSNSFTFLCENRNITPTSSTTHCQLQARLQLLLLYLLHHHLDNQNH